jgi:hypothetical protein
MFLVRRLMLPKGPNNNTIRYTLRSMHDISFPEDRAGAVGATGRYTRSKTKVA